MRSLAKGKGARETEILWGYLGKFKLLLKIITESGKCERKFFLVNRQRNSYDRKQPLALKSWPRSTPQEIREKKRPGKIQNDFFTILNTTQERERSTLDIFDKALNAVRGSNRRACGAGKLGKCSEQAHHPYR